MRGTRASSCVVAAEEIAEDASGTGALQAGKEAEGALEAARTPQRSMA